ncbi:arylsulfatase [Maricurvus nonylphenolicus]|uniref:arylsulfatase B n=1 Tax=Maricurvus nonylphenolicus TaxID=1008307 RepID=UPI0036F1AEE1
MFRAWITLAVVLVSTVSQAQLAPNIVLILADDMGWKDVGYHGSEINTPHIDRLATEGLRLDRFYTQPTCSPTRAALLTGNSSLALGVTGPLSKINPTGLPLNQRLLPEYLKEQHYQTALVGKWHLGYLQKAYGPRARGFDHFYGHLTGGIGYWDHVHGGGLDWQRNGKTLREDGYSTHLLRDEAIKVITERDKTKPLFLYASFNAPHLPNEAPEASIKRYAHLPDKNRQVHAAMVEELDAAIGSIVETLQQEGILDNTLIWFMSDNGGLNLSSYSGSGVVTLANWVDDWFDPGEAPFTILEFIRVNVLEGAADNTPLRKGKQSIYEGGVRVPSFVYWQGRLQPSELQQMITVQDVTPTLLAAAGLQLADQNFEGANHWPYLSGESKAIDRDRPYIIVSTDGEAVYRFPWKLLKLSSGETELYNLQQDPVEAVNLTEQFPDTVAKLQKDLESAVRGESIHIPIYKAIMNMDFFGGEETLPPWAEQVN